MKKILYFSILLFGIACQNQKTENTNTPPPKEVRMGEKVVYNEYLSFVYHQKFQNTYNVKAGDYLSMRFALLNDKGDTISSTYKNNIIADRLVDTVMSVGSIEPILTLVAPGDSLSVYVHAGKHYAITNQKLDSLINPNSELRYDFKILAVKPAQQKAEEMRLQQEEQLAQFVQKNQLKAQRSLEGLYVIEKEAGKGSPAAVGDSVLFDYKTYDLEGKMLVDGSGKSAVGFVLGRRTIIPAWDIAFRNYIKENGTYILLMPSHLCFGGVRREIVNYETGTNFMISPFTLLRSEITLRKIVRAKP